jgi:hypothetical protein
LKRLLASAGFLLGAADDTKRIHGVNERVALEDYAAGRVVCAANQEFRWSVPVTSAYPQVQDERTRIPE